jgi:hypothetical protein
MDFLRDPIVDLIIGVVVTIVVAFVVYVMQRNRKEMAYDVISNTLVLSIDHEVRGKIQVLYEGKPVDDARLVVLRIWNSGKVPISSNDFERPVTFDFGKDAEVLDATIFETKPSNLTDEAVLEKDINKVILRPLLLNRDDSIKFKVLLTRLRRNIQVSARISGINQIFAPEELPIRKRIRKVNDIIEFLLKLWFLFLVIITVFIISIYIINIYVFHLDINDKNFIILFISYLPIYLQIFYNFFIDLSLIAVTIIPLLFIVFGITIQVLKFMEYKLLKI